MSNMEKKVKRDEKLDLISDCLQKCKEYPFSHLLDLVENIEIPKISIKDLKNIFETLPKSNVRPELKKSKETLQNAINSFQKKRPSGAKPFIPETPISEIKVMTPKDKEYFFKLFSDTLTNRKFDEEPVNLAQELVARIQKEFPLDVEKQALYISYCEKEYGDLLHIININIENSQKIKETIETTNFNVVRDFVEEITKFFFKIRKEKLNRIGFI